MRGPQTCSPSVGGIAKMPSEKRQNNINNNNISSPNTRPVRPTISASSRSSKAPLTPKLAAASVTISPTLRRGIQSIPGGTSKPTVPREDISTPVRAFLNANVTPRSSARNTRSDSTQSTPAATPTDTPTNSRQPSTVDPNTNFHAAALSTGLGIEGLPETLSLQPKSFYTEGSISPTGGSIMNKESEKFFHASDARAINKSPTFNRPPPQSSNSSPFFYANGNIQQNLIQSLAPNRSIQDRIQSKFFHADSALETHSAPSSALSSSHPLKPNLSVATNQNALASSPLPRPSSQPKTNSSYHGQPADVRSAAMAPVHRPFLSQSASFNIDPKFQTHPVGTSRKLSIDSSSRRPSHSRSASDVSLISTSATKRIFPADAKVSFSPNGSLVTVDARPTVLSDASTTVSFDAVVNRSDMELEIAGPHIPQSPSKPATSKLREMNDLAANARRERKVLDLEISNSSLMAINRSLEREMRKQKAELRRFRRLSRQGRFSIATSMSIDTSLGEYSSICNSDDEINGWDEDEEEESQSEDESLLDGSLSPSAQEIYDTKHRARDEKRLQLDLAKHQQLLVDSQKLNQSLKRCLGWTEELIKEGRKALAYQVRVSDVELGGRVLALDEIEDREDVSIGVRTPQEVDSGVASDVKEINRDSGIDIDPKVATLLDYSQSNQNLQPG